MSTTPAPDLTIAPHVRAILAALGEDPDREGLLKTPERVEKSLPLPHPRATRRRSRT